MVIQMNREAKYEFYQSTETNSIEYDKQFWNAVNPTFSNGYPMGEKFPLLSGMHL